MSYALLFDINWVTVVLVSRSHSPVFDLAVRHFYVVVVVVAAAAAAAVVVVNFILTRTISNSVHASGLKKTISSSSSANKQYIQ